MCSVDWTRIPPDVILKIFEIFAERPADSTHRCGHSNQEPIDDPSDAIATRRPLTLSHVSHYWRNLALSYPLLWTNVVVLGRSELPFRYVERSRPAPFNLTIRACKTSQDLCGITELVYRQFTTEFRDDLDRVHSIHVDADRLDAAHIDRIFEAFYSHSLPNLKHLVLAAAPSERNGWIYLIDHEIGHVSLPQRLEGLESLFVGGLCHFCLPSGMAETLVRLDLYDIPEVTSFPDLMITLQNLRQLETLVLGERLASIPADATECPQITLPRLKNLAIDGEFLPVRVAESRSPCRPGCRCPFRNLVADNLEYLETMGPKFVLQHILPLVEGRARRNPRLPPLRLMACWVSVLSNSFKNFVQELHKNTHVHVRPLYAFRSPEDGFRFDYSWTAEFASSILYLGPKQYEISAGLEHHRRLPDNVRGETVHRRMLDPSGPPEPVIEKGLLNWF